ncbi:MAG TPA: DegT/DnrJ/EryC1/StrS family aminotransferase [Blastocatellia bacterium]|nr:DegT/DnrJ/EryC1/StrS family aminotransferase [Blastocatellia bacterium]
MSFEELALNGGKQAKRKPFPEWPVYDEQEIAAVNSVIGSRQWWRMTGSHVNEFEKEFAAYQGAKFALGVTNGTQAIELALAALDIGAGDEVIIPAFTFISTATAVLCANAVPVPVDIKPDTYCIDADAIENAITERTRAIIPVHMAGHPVDMDAILELAQKYGLPIIEDAAHAQGAEWKGARVGALDAGGIFSFQAGKLMTAGEGGLVLSNDEEFIERCFLYGNCGRPKTDRTYQHELLGSNCRISELQGAVLRVQMSRLDEQIARRAANAPLLDRLLGDIPGIVPQGVDPRVTRHSHYMVMFRYNAAEFGGLPRQKFVDALIAEGVPAFVAYPAIHRTPVFRNANFGPRWRPEYSKLPDYNLFECPVAEEVGDTVVWLHHRVLLGDEEDLVELADAIRKIQDYSWDGKGIA